MHHKLLQERKQTPLGKCGMPSFDLAEKLWSMYKKELSFSRPPPHTAWLKLVSPLSDDICNMRSESVFFHFFVCNEDLFSFQKSSGQKLSLSWAVFRWQFKETSSGIMIEHNFYFDVQIRLF